MHHVVRAEEARLRPWATANATGVRRAALVDPAAGSVHTGFGLCAIDAGGRTELHLHSFEESFYVLEGQPVLVLDGRAVRLEPAACGLIPVGVPHAWHGADDGEARWLEVAAPPPRDGSRPRDTFFLGESEHAAAEPLDVRDPRLRHFFLLGEGQMALDNLKLGAPVDAPTVSASMATALLAYSGITVKMLVDQRLDAQLHTMFMVEYQPGGVAQPHDHPLEEAYYILEGAVEAVADDARYLLRPGDFLWTGVGCVHAFYNTTDATVRWLETQSPQPPARHSYRFNRDWEYLEERLRMEADERR